MGSLNEVGVTSHMPPTPLETKQQTSRSITIFSYSMCFHPACLSYFLVALVLSGIVRGIGLTNIYYDVSENFYLPVIIEKLSPSLWSHTTIWNTVLARTVFLNSYNLVIALSSMQFRQIKCVKGNVHLRKYLAAIECRQFLGTHVVLVEDKVALAQLTTFFVNFFLKNSKIQFGLRGKNHRKGTFRCQSLLLKQIWNRRLAYCAKHLLRRYCDLESRSNCSILVTADEKQLASI